METSLECAPTSGGFISHHVHDYDENTFRIDDLLDLDNDGIDDIGAPIEDIENTTSVDSTTENSPSASLDGNYSPENPLSDHALVSELDVPMDALADLEWLSPYMVDEDFLPAAFPSYDGKVLNNDDETTANPQKNSSQVCEERSKDYSFTCINLQWIPPVRARRSKRSRTGGRVWTTTSPLLPKRSTFDSPHSSLFTFTTSDSSSATSRPPPPQKKMKPYHSKKNSQEAAPPRRCSHCLVQKTPQWRAGPDGPKTLCNACGVRYKSGRLLPEYRPAVSPTFLSEVHSNSHRKVLELRRQKESFPVKKYDDDEQDRREHSTVTEETYIAIASY